MVDTKTCSICGQVQPAEKFRGRRCLGCRVAQKREWRHLNPDKARRHTKRGNMNRKQEYVREHKAARGCEDCGERDPVVLDLHHVEDKTPAHASRRSVGWGLLSWEALEAELAKCRVLCANCHRRAHALEGR